MKRKFISVLIFILIITSINSISILATDINFSGLNCDPEYQEIKYPGMINDEIWNFDIINDNIRSPLLYDPPAITGDIGSWIEEINEATVLNYIQGLVNFGPRVTGSTACDNAGTYIYNEFENMSLSVRYNHWYNGKNVEATLEGVNTSSDKIFVVCGHYDSVSGSPGADDNAAGTVAAIAAAEILSQYQFQHTIRFVAFDGEEQGLIGSGYYCQEAAANGDNIIAALNADMIGFAISENDENNVKIYDNSASQWLTDYADDISQEYESEIGVLNVIDSGSSGGSDHSSFHSQGYNAIFYHEYNFNDYYHSPQDIIANMNMEYDAKVTRLIVATLAELAEPIILKADFMYSPDYPNTNEAINFIDQSMGDISSRHWDFGDGEGSSAVNPTHIYDTEGVYQVTLTVFDPDGKTDSISKEIGVWGNWPPNAIGTPDFYAGNNPVVCFDGSSSWDPDGNIVSYHWDFDDGGTSDEVAPCHTFSEDGIYDVVLTVTDDGGRNAETHCEIRMDAHTPPLTEAIVLGSFGNNGWLKSNAKIILDASDWTGVDYSKYKIDGGSWITYSEPFQIWTNGYHVIDFYSVDVYGNTEDVKSIDIKIDTVKPKLDVNLAGDIVDDWYTSPVTVTCSASDSGSGLYEVFYRIDGVLDDWSVYEGPFTISMEGEYVLRIYSEDMAGNTFGNNNPYSLKIDTIPPVTTYTLDGEGDNGQYYMDVTIGLSAVDSGIGLDATFYKLDGGEWNTYTNPVVVSTLGSHTFEFYSVDMLGKEETIQSVEFSINVINFDVEITNPENGLYLFGNKFINLQRTIIIGAITVEATLNPYDPESDPDYDYVEFFINDVSKATVSAAPFEWTWDEQAFGEHTIKVIAYHSGESVTDSMDVTIFHL